MKTLHKEEIYIKQHNLIDKLFDERSIFFDIETTGFSPTTASVYLIGCARKRGNYICIDQFFAENINEEKIILQAFLELLKQYNTIISYNGVGFDVPFLKAKCDIYSLEENFKDFSYIDVFKEISTIKSLLHLENYKQKTIEKFLDINRDDKFSGGDLINVYYEYVKAPSEDSLNKLMLHNYEDVTGMMDLMPILSYVELINGQYLIMETAIKPYMAIDGTTKLELFITLKNDYIVPKRLSSHINEYYININKESTIIRIPIYEGQLKYFYSNYKDYYYLPDEDIAIHKSLAEFVDKDYKEKCRAYNCYNKKEGKFLPQHALVMNPEFKADYKDKISYFELTDDFCESDVMLRRYVDSIFSQI